MAEIADSDIALLWRKGRLRYKLHAGQKAFYDHYRAWADVELKRREAGEELPVGDHPNVYFLDAARRYGKDYATLTIAIEDAIRRPGAILTYGTALNKDVGEIALPLVDEITRDCPRHLRPVFKSAQQSSGVPALYFPNGSIIKLQGLERGSDSLRGRWSDGVYISEAAFIDRLDYTITSVLVHQFQLRPWANILLNSTPPVDPGHDIDAIYWPDCKDRGAYWRATIYDNPRLSQAQIREEFRRQGGPDSPKARRELMCERVRFEDRVVVPEFIEAKHVQEFELPSAAYCYTVIDPGFRDLAGVVCVVYDFERQKLLITDEWAKASANTDEIAAAIKQCEKSYGSLSFWDGKQSMRANPYQRYSDIQLRLIADLQARHGLPVVSVDKTDADSALAALRTGFQNDQILIHPRCKKTIEQLNQVVWNSTHTSFARSERLGHGDLLDCLKYAFRHRPKDRNPFPPRGYEMIQQNGGSADGLWLRPHHFETGKRNKLLDTLNSILPKRHRR